MRDVKMNYLKYSDSLGKMLIRSDYAATLLDMDYVEFYKAIKKITKVYTEEDGLTHFGPADFVNTQGYVDAPSFWLSAVALVAVGEEIEDQEFAERVLELISVLPVALEKYKSSPKFQISK